MLAFGIVIYLEKHIRTHGLAMSNNGLLVLSLSIPAVQLHTPAKKASSSKFTLAHVDMQ